MNYLIMFLLAGIGALIVTFLVKQNRKVKEETRIKREKLMNKIKNRME